MVTHEPHVTRCARIAIDRESTEKPQVIVGFETQAKSFEGAFWETGWESDADTQRQNVAIVAYPLDCKRGDKS